VCDQVLKEYFQDKKKILANLNCFVDAVLLADAANLNEAKKVRRCGVVTSCYLSFCQNSDGSDYIQRKSHQEAGPTDYQGG
jgi:hypothetical protein